MKFLNGVLYFMMGLCNITLAFNNSPSRFSSESNMLNSVSGLSGLFEGGVFSPGHSGKFNLALAASRSGADEKSGTSTYLFSSLKSFFWGEKDKDIDSSETTEYSSKLPDSSSVNIAGLMDYDPKVAAIMAHKTKKRVTLESSWLKM